MRTFPSLYSALKTILPNSNTMNNIGKKLVVNYKEKIRKNEVEGDELTTSPNGGTVERKTKRGAGSPKTKLMEGGGILNQTKHKSNSTESKVGYFDEDHIKFHSKDRTIPISELVNIHHNNKKKPRRILTIRDKEKEIIKTEIRKQIAR